MKIYITKTIGEGLTCLSAFDNALYKAGLGNSNLIELSSVIPKDAEVMVMDGKIAENEKNIGNRAYVVISHIESDQVGQTISAGLGWTYSSKEKHGLFVEHQAFANPRRIQMLIDNSLTSMIGYRGNSVFDESGSQISTVTCEKNPVCALSVALYKTEDW